MATTKRTKSAHQPPETRKDILTNINKHFFPDKKEVKQVFLFITDTVTTKSCDEVIQELINLNMPRYVGEGKSRERAEPEEDVINLIVNSEGGDLASAISLVAVIEASTIPIRTIAIGECCSAGLVIFMAGHQRVMTPLTSILSHQLSAGAEGTYSNMKSTMRGLQLYHERMIQLYQKYTGLPRETIEKDLLGSDDVILTPEEAKNYNLCDLIMDLK